MSTPRIWVVLPVKSFTRGKSRLMAELGDTGRAALARELFEHVLSTLQATPELQGTLVITDGDDVAELAELRGARVLRDPPAPVGLAHVIDSALAELAARDVEAAIVLMGDLPRIRREDLVQVIEALRDAELVLCPDHTGECTNALGVWLRHALQTCFGQPHSFAAHQALAQSRQLTLRILENPRIAFDVDTHLQLNVVGTPSN